MTERTQHDPQPIGDQHINEDTSFKDETDAQIDARILEENKRKRLAALELDPEYVRVMAERRAKKQMEEVNLLTRRVQGLKTNKLSRYTPDEVPGIVALIMAGKMDDPTMPSSEPGKPVNDADRARISDNQPPEPTIPNPTPPETHKPPRREPLSSFEGRWTQKPRERPSRVKPIVYEHTGPGRLIKAGELDTNHFRGLNPNSTILESTTSLGERPTPSMEATGSNHTNRVIPNLSEKLKERMTHMRGLIRPQT